MEWVDSISEALDYIEKNLDEELTPESIAKHGIYTPVYAAASEYFSGSNKRSDYGCRL